MTQDFVGFINVSIDARFQHFLDQEWVRFIANLGVKTSFKSMPGSGVPQNVIQDTFYFTRNTPIILHIEYDFMLAISLHLYLKMWQNSV